MPDASPLRLRILGFFNRSGPVDYCAAALLIVATVSWSLLSGKDLNFDQLNYHFYIAHSFFRDRFDHDFMAANGQSYLNPLAYVPFYWMVMHGWPSALIGAILGAFHGSCTVLAYFITKALMPDGSRHAGIVAIFGGVLAFLSPVFLAEAGTTFADVPTAAMMLGAVLCALKSRQASDWWKDRATIAGLLLGIAGAMKLSNLVFGPACALLLILMQPSITRGARALLLLGAGSALGFVATQGYWGWQLWKALGNPLFPFFGQYFPTDIFPKEGATLERFLPESPLDSLLLPFRMMQSRSWVYTESISPDLRFAAIVVVAVVGGAFLLFRRRAGHDDSPAKARRELLALSLFFILAYGLWQWTSGNGRYGLVISLICGPLLAAAAHTLFSTRTSMGILATLTILQLIHLQSGELRWSHGPWTRTWYEASVPERLRREPFLYISIGNNSNSYIYPFLAADSAFTNPLGQIAFDLDGPGGKQLRALLDKHQGRIRMLALAPPPAEGEVTLPAWTATIDSHVSRLGLAVDPSDCETISAAGALESGQDFTTDIKVRRIRSCRLVPRPFALAEERARITKIAKEVVSWCPKLFKPAYTVMERTADAWSAAYPSTDSRMVFKDGVIYGVFVRSSVDLKLSTVEQWERGQRPSCDSFPDKPRKTYTFE